MQTEGKISSKLRPWMIGERVEGRGRQSGRRVVHARKHKSTQAHEQPSEAGGDLGQPRHAQRKPQNSPCTERYMLRQPNPAARASHKLGLLYQWAWAAAGRASIG